MRNSTLAAIGRLRVRTARHVKAVCVASCLAVVGITVSAQTVTRTATAKSGSFFFFGNHIGHLSATEVGHPSASSQVRIEIRDAADHLVAQDEGPLTSRTPVQMTVTAPADGRPRLWRAVVTITTSTAAELTKPMLVFEDVDPRSQTVHVLALAGPPPDPPAGPVSGGDGAKTICQPPPGFVYFTAE
jgi:hypothetical protein